MYSNKNNTTFLNDSASRLYKYIVAILRTILDFKAKKSNFYRQTNEQTWYVRTGGLVIGNYWVWRVFYAMSAV